VAPRILTPAPAICRDGVKFHHQASMVMGVGTGGTGTDSLNREIHTGVRCGQGAHSRRGVFRPTVRLRAEEERAALTLR
jgi:hypothetical protein